MITSDINGISNLFFQPALSGLGFSHASGLDSDCLGKLVTDADDVNQCILVILTTPKGSSPHRPLFGSNLHLYIDYPIDRARPHIVREAVDALRAWEPRIEVVTVSVSVSGVAELTCQVEWKFVDGVGAESFVANLRLGFGA